jgi:multidrug transporter EmrE-like cation transporter
MKLINPGLVPLALLVVSTLLAAAGQILLKMGATGSRELTDFLNLRVLTGLGFYGVSTLLWIWALSKVPLSMAYSFTALTFLMVFLGSLLIVKESVGLLTFAGVALIVSGFLCVAAGSQQG